MDRWSNCAVNLGLPWMINIPSTFRLSIKAVTWWVEKSNLKLVAINVWYPDNWILIPPELVTIPFKVWFSFWYSMWPPVIGVERVFCPFWDSTEAGFTELTINFRFVQLDPTEVEKVIWVSTPVKLPMEIDWVGVLVVDWLPFLYWLVLSALSVPEGLDCAKYVHDDRTSARDVSNRETPIKVRIRRQMFCKGGSYQLARSLEGEFRAWFQIVCWFRIKKFSFP